MAVNTKRGGWKSLAGVATVLLLIASLATAEIPVSADGVEAVWKPHKLDFEYRGYNTIYTCRSLRGKLTKILLNLGARNAPTLSAYTCDESLGVARFQVTFDSPIEATPANVRALTTYDSREILIARMNGQELPTAADIERFPATWKTVSFARDMKMQMDPGDCELVQQLRQQILSRMSVQVIESGRCSAFGNISRPRLTVSALVAVDEK